MMKPTRRLFLVFLFLFLCAAGGASQRSRKPKLVLAVVVDQFRYDYLLRFRADYHSGIARLLENGAVFADARYIHFPTVTAVGHSTFLSGATPSVSGIISNEWLDRESNEPGRCADLGGDSGYRNPQRINRKNSGGDPGIIRS